MRLTDHGGPASWFSAGPRLHPWTLSDAASYLRYLSRLRALGIWGWGMFVEGYFDLGLAFRNQGIIVFPRLAHAPRTEFRGFWSPIDIMSYERYEIVDTSTPNPDRSAITLRTHSSPIFRPQVTSLRLSHKIWYVLCMRYPTWIRCHQKGRLTAQEVIFRQLGSTPFEE